MLKARSLHPRREAERGGSVQPLVPLCRAGEGGRWEGERELSIQELAFVGKQMTSVDRQPLISLLKARGQGMLNQLSMVMRAKQTLP
jgi:hypothetical protein